MRVPNLRSVAAGILGAWLVVVVVGPSPARAQCGMMGGGGGGGHNHGAMQTSRAPKPTASEKKLRKSIDQVLADETGRALLADALLEDQAFMESLLKRMAAIPEWRAMASGQLAAPAPAVTGGNGSPAVPSAPLATYVCPMHADVTASAPGDCPKCGMALVRRDARRD